MINEPEKIRQLFDELLRVKPVPFPGHGALNITCEKGVYIIYTSDGSVAHVGNTPSGKRGLCQRLNDHIGGSSSFAKNHLKPKGISIRDGFTYSLLVVPTPRDRMLLQALACGMLCPTHLGTHQKSDLMQSL